MSKVIGDFILQENYLTCPPRLYCKCLKRNGIKYFQHISLKTDQQTKSYSAQTIKKPPNYQNLKTQVYQMKKLNSQNVLSHYEFLETANNYYVFTEYCNEGTLEQMFQNGQFTEDEAQNYLRQLLNGLKTLHEAGICNCDFNANSIFKHNGVVKIGQVCLPANVIYTLETDQDFQKIGAVKEYFAPEVLEGNTPTIQSDLYSIGILYYKMLYGRFPYQATTRSALIQSVSKQKLEFDEQRKVSNESKDFLKRILVYDIRQRLKWSDVYRHSLLRNLNVPDNVPVEQSILMTNASMNKVITFSGLNIQKFDVKENENFYSQNEMGIHQEPVKNSQFLEPKSGSLSSERGQDELKYQTQLNQIFFLDQIQSNFKIGLHYLQIIFRNIYARMCKSLTNIRVLKDQSSLVLQTEFLVEKSIFALSKKIIIGIRNLEPWAKQLQEYDQGGLVNAFIIFKRQIEMENKIITKQFEQALQIMNSRLQRTNDFPLQFCKTVDDTINFDFFRELESKLIKYTTTLKKSDKGKLDIYFTELHIQQLNSCLILLLLLIMNRHNEINRVFGEAANIYLENLNDIDQKLLQKEAEKTTKILNDLIKDFYSK